MTRTRKRTARKPRRPTGPTAGTRHTVTTRDLGACLLCGTRAGLTVHHRIPRGRGGTNDPANLITLCGSGTTGCHGYLERERLTAYRGGYLLHTGTDPTTVPILTRTGAYLLTSEGTRLAHRPTSDGTSTPHSRIESTSLDRAGSTSTSIPTT